MKYFANISDAEIQQYNYIKVFMLNVGLINVKLNEERMSNKQLYKLSLCKPQKFHLLNMIPSSTNIKWFLHKSPENSTPFTWKLIP